MKLFNVIAVLGSLVSAQSFAGVPGSDPHSLHDRLIDMVEKAANAKLAEHAHKAKSRFIPINLSHDSMVYV